MDALLQAAVHELMDGLQPWAGEAHRFQALASTERPVQPAKSMQEEGSVQGGPYD